MRVASIRAAIVLSAALLIQVPTTARASTSRYEVRVDIDVPNGLLQETLLVSAASPVQGEKGPVNVGELKPGDRVHLAGAHVGTVRSLTPATMPSAVDGQGVVEGISRLRTNKTVNLDLGDEVIETTPEHRFYVVGRGWVPAGELSMGARLDAASAAGSAAARTVLHVETKVGPVHEVMNLIVKDKHTFRVGKHGVLVHNGDCAYALAQGEKDTLVTPAQPVFGKGSTMADRKEIFGNSGMTSGITPNKSWYVQAVPREDAQALKNLYWLKGALGDREAIAFMEPETRDIRLFADPNGGNSMLMATRLKDGRVAAVTPWERSDRIGWRAAHAAPKEDKVIVLNATEAGRPTGLMGLASQLPIVKGLAPNRGHLGVIVKTERDSYHQTYQDYYIAATTFKNAKDGSTQAFRRAFLDEESAVRALRVAALENGFRFNEQAETTLVRGIDESDTKLNKTIDVVLSKPKTNEDYVDSILKNFGAVPEGGGGMLLGNGPAKVTSANSYFGSGLKREALLSPVFRAVDPFVPNVGFLDFRTLLPGQDKTLKWTVKTIPAGPQ